MQHVFAVASRVAALLDGATDPDPAQHGLTTEEERAAAISTQVRLPLHVLYQEIFTHSANSWTDRVQASHDTHGPVNRILVCFMACSVLPSLMPKQTLLMSAVPDR